MMASRPNCENRDWFTASTKIPVPSGHKSPATAYRPTGKEHDATMLDFPLLSLLHIRRLGRCEYELTRNLGRAK
jgi:hypothetical protein